jgi:CCR4-NOT transcription complex subunit 7/8
MCFNKYKNRTSNVGLAKNPLKVGLALVNKLGELPPTKDVWQFNFHFNVHEDMSLSDSIDMLRSAGIDFTRHQVFI